MARYGAGPLHADEARQAAERAEQGVLEEVLSNVPADPLSNGERSAAAGLPEGGFCRGSRAI
jgi:hydroxypyruvate isomerase